MLTITIGKVARAVGRRLGRGSVLPGRIALALDRHLLAKFTLPAVVIAITGSGGKTTTSSLLRDAASNAGLKVVSNAEGSNMAPGIATALIQASDRHGRVPGDVAILECEERHCQYLFPDLRPGFVVITNLSRDQVARNGYPQFVAGEIAKALTPAMTLLLNVDDPLVNALGRDGRVIPFSVEADALREPAGVPHRADDSLCPNCGLALDYDYRIIGNLGRYHCGHCGYQAPAPQHSVSAVVGTELVIDDDYRAAPQIMNPAFAYNILAAYVGLVEAMGVTPQAAADGLTHKDVKNALQDRVMTFQMGEHRGVFLLSKHENTLTYNVSLRTIADSAERGYTLGVMLHRVSRKYFAGDVSWLWDIDWEVLAKNPPAKVLLGGRFANDIAVRLVAAGIDQDIIEVDLSLDGYMDLLRRQSQGTIFFLTGFEDIDQFTSRLRKDEQ
ncbi:MAG: MurT ligase domain-containing protein [Propionibacteriaceae bacterium]|jgi:UDP-N-acetylmuramyl tripeptide synthase|nr:MurT ligase domain-containing protein [Propionibacteriaceae bacterium]